VIFEATEATFERDVVERSRQLPVVVDFWAEWCGPCRMLTPVLEQAVQARDGAVALAKVDTDANPRLSAAFGIQGIPAVKAFADGRVVDEFTGAQPPAAVDRFLDALLPSEADALVAEGGEAELRRALELEPGRADAAVAHARILRERGGHRVIAYDARGHGRSAPAPEYGYDALAADLVAVLDAAGIERAVLAGASMGAHTIAALALAHPERTAALVLITPAFDPDGDPGLERWDRLSDGLRHGGVDGFVAAYGEPRVPERMRDTVRTVLRQRLSAHEHPDAVADALAQVPRSRPFERWDELGAIDVPVTVVASRDEADPEHPYATGVGWARAIPDAELRSEEPGSSPLAWQGGQLSRVIAETAARAAANPTTR
jgi:thioredoxin